MLKVSEEQTMTKNVLCVFNPLYHIYTWYIYPYAKLIYLYRIHMYIYIDNIGEYTIRYTEILTDIS